MALFRRFSRPAGGETHIEATDARQGLRGRHVLWMLVASTALAVAALFGSWMFRAGDLAAADASRTPTAAEVQAAGAPVR
jgi:hypothetical protein